MKALTLPSLFLIVLSHASLAQITGKWISVDDESGKKRALVEIYSSGDSMEGRILELYDAPANDPDPVCRKCPESDSRYMQKIIGMVIIQGMMADGEEFAGGTVLKPDEGEIYRCRMWLENGDLKVRGYRGPFYRTQTWIKSN